MRAATTSAFLLAIVASLPNDRIEAQTGSPTEPPTRGAEAEQPPVQAPPGTPRGPRGKPPAHVPAAGYQRFVTEMFAVDVPEHWRELLPNESVLLDLPADFPPVRPGWAHVLGDVDSWTENGYDGQALVAMVSGEFEAPADEERLAAIEEHWNTTELADGSTREVLHGEVTQIGQTDHPCLAFEVLTHPVTGPAERCLEFHASTRGRELILSFRTWDDAYAESEARLRAMADTLAFPRPPRTAKELGDRLFDAALVGGAVGLILIGLRYIARQRGRRG